MVLELDTAKGLISTERFGKMSISWSIIHRFQELSGAFFPAKFGVIEYVKEHLLFLTFLKK